MYTSASATGSTSSVSMVPGPVLSKSVRNELLPVSTRPAAGFSVVPGFRSDGNALDIWLGSPSYPAERRRRRAMKPAMPRSAITPTPPARYSGLSRRSSTRLGGGGARFFGAAFFGTGLGAAAVFGASGLGASAFGASLVGACVAGDAASVVGVSAFG